METPKINDTQKQILREIDESEEELGTTDLSNKLDLSTGGIHKNVQKLQDLELIHNKDYKGQGSKNRYVLRDNVEVNVNMKLEKLLNWKVGIHILEIILFMSIYMYTPLEYASYLFIGFVAGFVPTFLLTADYVFKQNDFKEIKVMIYDQTP